jgi:hypothetical protein
MIESPDRVLVERANDLLRVARMSELYYECRLTRANRFHLFFEIAIALGTTGAVATWALWKTDVGGVAWGVITGMATLLAVIKPILAPAKTIELCTRQHQGWLALFFGLDKFLLNVRQEGEVSSEARKRFDTLYDRSVQLHLEDEKHPSTRLLAKMQEAVNVAHPPETLWMPCGLHSREGDIPPATSASKAAGSLRVVKEPGEQLAIPC